MENDEERKRQAREELTDRLLAEESGSLANIDVDSWPRLSGLSSFLRGGQCTILGGPQNVGKSFWVLNVLRAVRDADVKAAYLPLEDDRAEFLKRCIALETGSYIYTQTDQDGASIRLNYLISEEGKAVVDKYAPSVYQNPRTPQEDESGAVVVPSLPSDWILDWMSSRMREGARVLFIDPVTQINFGGGRNALAKEEEFIRSALGLVAQFKATCVFVMHTKKLFGKPEGFLPGIEDLAGSSLWAKLCQTVVLLCAHDEKQSDVVKPSSIPGVRMQRTPATHNRTVKIEKARYARGARMSLAYSQDPIRPEFTELGVLAKGKS